LLLLLLLLGLRLGLLLLLLLLLLRLRPRLGLLLLGLGLRLGLRLGLGLRLRLVVNESKIIQVVKAIGAKAQAQALHQVIGVIDVIAASVACGPRGLSCGRCHWF
jgi:hypothetical protein